MPSVFPDIVWGRSFDSVDLRIFAACRSTQIWYCSQIWGSNLLGIQIVENTFLRFFFCQPALLWLYLDWKLILILYQLKWVLLCYIFGWNEKFQGPKTVFKGAGLLRFWNLDLINPPLHNSLWIRGLNYTICYVYCDSFLSLFPPLRKSTHKRQEPWISFILFLQDIYPIIISCFNPHW